MSEDKEHVITIRCNPEAKPKVEEVVEIMQHMGHAGSSRTIDFGDQGSVFFDGDGSDRIYEVSEEKVKQSSYSDIPQYQPSTGSKSCANCGAFKDGYCEMFDAMVQSDFVCSEWVEEGEYKKSSSLESGLIELGEHHPDLREDIRPILNFINE